MVQHVPVLHSFLWLSNIPLNGYTAFLIHSSVDGHLYCFYFLDVMNNTAMNTHAQMFVFIHVFNSLGLFLGVELLGHMVTLCLTF